MNIWNSQEISVSIGIALVFFFCFFFNCMGFSNMTTYWAKDVYTIFIVKEYFFRLQIYIYMLKFYCKIGFSNKSLNFWDGKLSLFTFRVISSSLLLLIITKIDFVRLNFFPLMSTRGCWKGPNKKSPSLKKEKKTKLLFGQIWEVD